MKYKPFPLPFNWQGQVTASATTFFHCKNLHSHTELVPAAVSASNKTDQETLSQCSSDKQLTATFIFLAGFHTPHPDKKIHQGHK